MDAKNCFQRCQEKCWQPAAISSNTRSHSDLNMLTKDPQAGNSTRMLPSKSKARRLRPWPDNFGGMQLEGRHLYRNVAGISWAREAQAGDCTGMLARDQDGPASDCSGTLPQ